MMPSSAVRRSRSNHRSFFRFIGPHQLMVNIPVFVSTILLVCAGFRWPIHSISIIWFMGTTMVVPNMLVICRHFSVRTNENPVPELDPFKCRKKRICYTEVLHIKKKSPPWFQIPELRDRSKSRYQARNRKTLLPLK